MVFMDFLISKVNIYWIWETVLLEKLVECLSFRKLNIKKIVVLAKEIKYLKWFRTSEVRINVIHILLKVIIHGRELIPSFLEWRVWYSKRTDQQKISKKSKELP